MRSSKSRHGNCLHSAPAQSLWGRQIEGGQARQQTARHAQQVVGQRASADTVAAQIVAAAAAGRRLLLPGAVARQAWWVTRLAPRLYEHLMARRLRAEMQGDGDA